MKGQNRRVLLARKATNLRRLGPVANLPKTRNQGVGSQLGGFLAQMFLSDDADRMHTVMDKDFPKGQKLGNVFHLSSPRHPSHLAQTEIPIHPLLQHPYRLLNISQHRHQAPLPQLGKAPFLIPSTTDWGNASLQMRMALLKE